MSGVVVNLHEHRLERGESVERAMLPELRQLERTAQWAWWEWRKAAVRCLVRLQFRDLPECKRQIEWCKGAALLATFVRWYVEAGP